MLEALLGRVIDDKQPSQNNSSRATTIGSYFVHSNDQERWQLLTFHVEPHAEDKAVVLSESPTIMLPIEGKVSCAGDGLVVILALVSGSG